jgi:hypothetical protein
MKCNYRYCGKNIDFGRPDRKFCNKNCKSRENKLTKEIKSLDMKVKKTKDFIEKSKIKHNNKFIYDLVVYDSCRVKIKIICPTHGIFEQTPDGHLYKSYGCESCARENHKLTHIPPERLKKIKTTHSNKYSYNDLTISNGKIKIICPTHGEFIQTIYNHENGHGCYKCEKESRIKIRTKICKSCNIDKSKSEYSLKYRICKSCFENKIIPESKFCNKCGVLTPIDDFYIRLKSKDNHRNECKTCFNLLRIEPRKLYKKKNRKVLQEKDMKYRKERMRTDSLYRAKTDARNIVRKALTERGYSKKSKTEEILGCSFLEFKNHIESQFSPNMNWENRNEWHIDHIIPLDFGITESEILKLNHYKNLRPLWEKDNLSKSNIIVEETDIYHEIVSGRL